MSYKKSEHWKDLKESMIVLALGHYHESLHDDHADMGMLEEVMSDYGFFQDDSQDHSKPSLTVIAGEGTPKKRTKRAKLKLHSN